MGHPEDPAIEEGDTSTHIKIEREPRWPALVALLAAGVLYLAMPEPLSVGPSWMLLAIILVLLIPITVAHRSGYYKASHILVFAANILITVAMISSLGYLIYGIERHLYSPTTLLRSASALWITNVLVFALWYWKVDAGGPLGRESRHGRLDSSFLFPQMLTADSGNASWSPHFIDYLFLAFNTSTAFSPTDTAVLSRWAKIVMMAQALISLTIVALLAARAVNIL
jgi:hypothetical protein